MFVCLKNVKGIVIEQLANSITPIKFNYISVLFFGL